MVVNFIVAFLTCGTCDVGVFLPVGICILEFFILSRETTLAPPPGVQQHCR